MSGKYAKKSRKQSQKHRKSSPWRWIGPGILLVAVAVVVIFLLTLTEGEGGPTPAPTEPTEVSTAPREETAQIGNIRSMDLNLGSGLKVTEMGGYTGVYMEDGSDDVVSGVLMIVVKNTGEENVEYGEITLASPSGEEATFSVSTLPAGESVVLLEKNRMEFDPETDFATGIVENLAFYREELSLCESQIRIDVVGGAINVQNISGEAITGDIRIYYKNSSDDMLYGGITYLARLEGGLQKDELRQIMPSHFSQQGSRILFVVIG